MKKLFFFIQLLFVCSFVHAQVITAEEMLSKADCTASDCFGRFIEGKGFKYSRTQNYPGNQKMLTYTVEGSENLASFMYDSINKMTMVSFTTTDTVVSKELVHQLTTLGFTKIYSENLPDRSIITTYESRKHKRLSASHRAKTTARNGAEVTTHYFTIQKG